MGQTQSRSICLLVQLSIACADKLWIQMLVDMGGIDISFEVNTLVRKHTKVIVVCFFRKVAHQYVLRAPCQG